MLNKSAFRSKMIYYGDTYESIGEFLGISLGAVSNKVNGRFAFTQDEIAKLKTRWNLGAEELDEIFFR